MWRVAFKFFQGTLVGALLTNAVAVYLLHDVDADRIGNWNLAYRELMSEFFMFSAGVACIFLLLIWIGTVLFRLRKVTFNLKLAFLLGIAIIVIQYPAEFAARKMTNGSSPDAFLLGYLLLSLLSPLCCAVVLLLDARKRCSESSKQQAQELNQLSS